MRLPVGVGVFVACCAMNIFFVIRAASSVFGVGAGIGFIVNHVSGKAMAIEISEAGPFFFTRPVHPIPCRLIGRFVRRLVCWSVSGERLIRQSVKWLLGCLVTCS